jgi:uncharacterized protein YbjT (DUF2867 family)
MTMPVTTVLAVGATGQTGRVVVATALEHGLRVRALARDLDRARRLLPGAEVVEGDLTDAATLGDAVDGVDAVLFTHGAPGGVGAYDRVDYGGVANVLRALGDRRPRIALMTSINITTTTSGPYADLMSWKRRSERLVRASRASYTIVRPGWLDTGSPNDGLLVLAQGDTGTGAVSRFQVADVLVGSLLTEEADGRTFELFATTGNPPQDLPALFAATTADQPGDLNGAHDLPTLPIEDEPPAVRRDLDAVALDAVRPN